MGPVLELLVTGMVGFLSALAPLFHSVKISGLLGTFKFTVLLAE